MRTPPVHVVLALVAVPLALLVHEAAAAPLHAWGPIPDLADPDDLPPAQDGLDILGIWCDLRGSTTTAGYRQYLRMDLQGVPSESDLAGAMYCLYLDDRAGGSTGANPLMPEELWSQGIDTIELRAWAYGAWRTGSYTYAEDGSLAGFGWSIWDPLEPTATLEWPSYVPDDSDLAVRYFTPPPLIRYWGATQGVEGETFDLTSEGRYVTPEPSSGALLLLGMVGLRAFIRRRREP